MKFMVIEPRAGAVLSVAEDKTEALSCARRVLTAADESACGFAEKSPQKGLWSDEESYRGVLGLATPPRPIPRRRREIFAASNGRCHYCGAALTLDGRWHVEHMMPRALGGDDDVLNLVVACVRCNLAKSDRTAIEFVAGGLESRRQ